MPLQVDQSPVRAPEPSAADDGQDAGPVGALLRRIGDDLKVIARDEVELVRDELQRSARAAVADVGVAVLGAVVSLVGIAMLCTVVVAALAPAIPALWVRLLIMAIVYLVVGGVLAGGFAKRLGADMPHLTIAKHEGHATLRGIGEAVHPTQAHHHA